MCVDLKWIYALDIYSIKNNKVQMHISPWCNCNGLKRTCSGLFYQSEISLVPSFSSATPLHYLGEHYSTPLCPECPLHLAQRHTRTHTYMQDMRMHIHRWCRLLSLCSKIPWLWKCSLTLSHTHTHTYWERLHVARLHVRKQPLLSCGVVRESEREREKEKRYGAVIDVSLFLQPVSQGCFSWARNLSHTQHAVLKWQ